MDEEDAIGLPEVPQPLLLLGEMSTFSVDGENKTRTSGKILAT